MEKETLKQYYRRNNLLTISADSKTVKGEKLGYLTGILYLSPHKISGKNFCTFATAGCIKGCLNTAGRGQMDCIQEARLKRSAYMITDKENFMLELYVRIQGLIKKADNLNLIPVIRLNGTSDLRFENLKFNYNNKKRTLMQIFKSCQFYDYTKFPYEARPNEKLPSNYHLTYSYSEKTTQAEFDNLPNRNMAVVFDLCKLNYRGSCALSCKCDMLKKWQSYKVIDGDISDLRFLDEKNVIVGLRAKGDARKNPNDFIVRIRS